jgi:hypothetical protein
MYAFVFQVILEPLFLEESYLGAKFLSVLLHLLCGLGCGRLGVVGLSMREYYGVTSVTSVGRFES